MCRFINAKRIIRVFFLLVISIVVPACASYHFQTSVSPLVESQGIKKIYITPLQNNSYKAGIENIVFNELVRVIAAKRRVQIVSSIRESDAVLTGIVSTATSEPGGGTTSDNLFPSKDVVNLKGSPDLVVNTEFIATLGCSFSLNRTHTEPGKKQLVWASGFGRAKPFPATNQMDIFGSTSPLINESEFDRALKELAESMMSDLHESMLSMF